LSPTGQNKQIVDKKTGNGEIGHIDLKNKLKLECQRVRKNCDTPSSLMKHRMPE